MSEENIIRHCAPTLASIKTANMFTCPFTSRQEMLESIRAFNRRFLKKGLRVLPLRYRDGVGLIYVYRPEKLSRDLERDAAGRLLKKCGYAGCAAPACLRHLMARLDAQADFPHEIGLFLGYPPEDVDGFMHKRCAIKCAGYWKVYHNEDEARALFARYKKCSALYMKLWREGRSIERLTVAV